MIKNKNNNQKGFSLVETLVAISILLIVVTGPMAISIRSAKSASFATEQVQAFFLAQEGLEMVQKGRDDLLLRNFLPTSNGNYINNPWYRFTDSTNSGTYRHCYASTGCGLAWGGTVGQLATVVSCSSVSNCLLYRGTTGRAQLTHTAAGATPTIFTRRIYLTASGEMVQARSLVTWRTGSVVAEQSVSTDTYFYNIYDTP
jgi:prepilin-type N-terminal cleavage/methylation domain-containing protein